MQKYVVQLGGAYLTEAVPGTVADPTLLPQTVNWLDPVYLSIGGNGHLNELRCISNMHAEDFTANVTRGMWIQIPHGYGSQSGSGSGGPAVIFDGVVVNTHVVIGGDSEHTELIAYDHGSYLLHRITVHGQWRRGYAKEQTYYDTGVSAATIVVAPADMQLIDAPLCFNPDGQPNKTQDQFETLGTSHETSPPSFSMFEVPFRDQVNVSGQRLQAAYWTLKDALMYLLNVTNASWCIDPTSYNETAINAVLGTNNPVVSNIVCEGKTLVQALSELLTPHNYGYWVDPSLNSNNLHDIKFYARGKGPQKQLVLSAKGTKAAFSQANMVQCDLLMDNASTINRIESYGDRISVTTLAHTNPPLADPVLPLLVKCWNGTDLVFPAALPGETQPNWYDPKFRYDYCNPQLLTPLGSGSMDVSGSGSSSGAVFGVGRMWVVNLGEDPWASLENLQPDFIGSASGSGSTSTSGSGGASLTDTAMTGNNNVDMRRFEKPELYVVNSEGGLLAQEEVIVEMSTNNGSSWEIVDRSEYRILADSLGIVFTNPNLDLLGIDLSAQDGSGSGSSSSGNGFGKGYWQALHDNTLQIRILASIKSDERVHARINNDGTAFPLAIGGVYNNTGYKKTLYNDAIEDAIYYVNYPPSRIIQDDTPALLTLTQTQIANTNRTQISGAARVLFEQLDQYQIGDVITAIANRAINLSAGSDPGPTVVHIVHKFQEKQTELTLDNHRVATVIKAKAINAASNYRQHKLGIENPVANQGGHSQPFLPETNSQAENKSWERYLENGRGI